MVAPESVSKILVVVPVYNHAETLRTVVAGVLTLHSAVLVVDDGSRRSVADLLAGMPVAQLSHATNLGKGAALLSAASWGLQRGYSHMICLDADGQHDPADLPKFINAIADHPQSVIVGHRDFAQDSIPAASRFGRKFSNFWLRLQTGSQLKDTQSGFRAYPLMLFARLNFWTRRYNFEVEVLVRSAWAGVELRDVDISVYYPPHNERVSHFRGFMDNWRLTLLNTHLTLRSIVPWPHKKIIERTSAAGQPITGLSLFQPYASIRQLLRENNRPQRLAVAAGIGVFLGTVPLIALHTIAILFTCGFFRLNKLAAVSSSQLCMPPIVPALCIELGYYFRHGQWLTELTLQTLGYQAVERFYEWFLGSLLLAPLFALLIGALTYCLAKVAQKEDAEAN